MDQQLLQFLRATLSQDESTRQGAEVQLKQLWRTGTGEDIGLSRGRAASTTDESFLYIGENPVDMHLLPHSAGVLLQQYITRHWTPVSIQFEDPVTPLEVSGLSTLTIKIDRNPSIVDQSTNPSAGFSWAVGFSTQSPHVSCMLATRNTTSPRSLPLQAFALSSIARWDWPDEYPDLLAALVNLLISGSAESVHGAMRVVTEFVKNDLAEDQLLPVIRDLVPALLVILGNPQMHSFSTRASTIHVFRQVVRMLETVKDEHPQAVKSALDELCPIWFGAFTQLLSIDAASEVSQNWEALAVRIEIFRTFSLFQSTFKPYITSALPSFFHLALQNLTSLLPLFTAHYVSSDPDAPEPPSPTSDAGFNGPKMDLDDLACAVFDFLTPAVRTPKIAPILVKNEVGTDVMENIIGIVLAYTQVTRENEEEWLEDANAFVADDDDETEMYGLRVNGHDLIGSIINKWPAPVAKILQDLTSRRVQESAAAKQSGNADWWKPLESNLSLLGGISDDIRSVLETDAEEGRPGTFNITLLFDQVIPGLLDQSSTPFLQGRAFVFASQYASSLPEGLAAQYISAATHALESPSVTVPVKISAVKTIKNFCRFVNAEVLKPHSAKILTLLLPLLQQTTNETLYLLLETVRAVLALEKELLSPQSTGEVAERVYEVWLKFTTDPVLTAVVEELFEAISSLPSPEIVGSLVDHVAPKLAGCISAPVTDDTIHLPGEAVQLANSMLRTRAGPLEAGLISTVTAAIMECLRGTDDMDVIQHGMIHLTLVVRKDCDKLVQWHDASGNNGIATIFGLLGRFLAPTFSESGGIFVGDLIMHLFRKAGTSMAPVLGDLLRGVVERLSTAQMPSFIQVSSVELVRVSFAHPHPPLQSLVLPFAYLFGTEYTQSTIDLLGFSVTLPDGSTKPALELVLSAWCETSDTIAGSWNIRVSNLGMSRLFLMPMASIQNVMVRGDLIVSDANRNTIMTRSRTKQNPHEYTIIPFPLKALKLLLKDLSGSEGPKGKKTMDYEIDSDDGDGDWDDDDPLDDVGEFDFLSSWMDAGGGNLGNDAQDDDEDLRSDPLAQIDMPTHLSDMLRTAYANNTNNIHQMIEGLGDQDKAVLRRILTL
ncbi:importin-9, partial [Tremellales sp. Uapishka_1]